MKLAMVVFEICFQWRQGWLSHIWILDAERNTKTRKRSTTWCTVNAWSWTETSTSWEELIRGHDTSKQGEKMHQKRAVYKRKCVTALWNEKLSMDLEPDCEGNTHEWKQCRKPHRTRSYSRMRAEAESEIARTSRSMWECIISISM